MRTRQMFLSPCNSAPWRCITMMCANQRYKSTVLCLLAKIGSGLISMLLGLPWGYCPPGGSVQVCREAGAQGEDEQRWDGGGPCRRQPPGWAAGQVCWEAKWWRTPWTWFSARKLTLAYLLTTKAVSKMTFSFYSCTPPHKFRLVNVDAASCWDRVKSF